LAKNPNKSQVKVYDQKTPTAAGAFAVTPVRPVSPEFVYEQSDSSLEALGYMPRAAIFVGATQPHAEGPLTDRGTPARQNEANSPDDPWTSESNPYKVITSGGTAAPALETGALESRKRRSCRLGLSAEICRE
jgi:hypothetical protein